MKVIAIIPAHNEERLIERAIASVRDEVSFVVVANDRSTDCTSELATSAGALTIDITENSGRRAGALNIALTEVWGLGDAFLIMDADCIIRPGFVRTAIAKLQSNPNLGGVSGTIQGDGTGGLVGRFQDMECERTLNNLKRRRGKVRNCSGGASLFRAEAIKRGYIEKALAEDHELALMMLHAGWEIIGSPQCLFETENMPSWGALWHQRLRWERGGADNLLSYGLTLITIPYWGAMLLRALNLVVQIAIITLITWTVIAEELIASWWLLLTLLFVFERVWSVRRLGARYMILAGTYIPELIYGWLQMATWIIGVSYSFTGRKDEWVIIRSETTLERG